MKYVVSVSFVALLAVGCSCAEDVVATPCTLDTDCATGLVCVDGRCVDSTLDGGAPGLDGAIGDASRTDGSSDYCLGSGPPLQVGDSVAPECAGRLAERSFRYAICTCDGLVSSNLVRTDSFDSRGGPYAPGGTGGSLGTNADLNGSADWSIGGSFWSSGTGGWSSSASLVIASELHMQGRLAGHTVEVARDAFVAGGVQAMDLRVDGTLTVPEGASIDVLGASAIGATVRAPVMVPPPCACGDDEIVDVGAFVEFHATENENALAGVDPSAYGNLTTATTLDLPCGRYYLDRVAGSGSLTVRTEGRVALFIGGDISLSGGFEVIVPSDAEVDIFVGGNIVTSGAFSIGNIDAPSRSRLYVGGTGTVELAAGAVFAGNLYAPRAELVAAGTNIVYGALFVERLSASGALDVHYDTSVLRSGDPCDTPETCDGCGDCPSVQACIDGACGECRTSADCCAPLICSDGVCVSELI